jgi:membrane protein YqaA with SNARE-associated domain
MQVSDMPTQPPKARWRNIIQAVGIVLLALVLNLFVVTLPQAWFEGWGNYGYIGVFLVTLLANASVFIPVPYPGIVAKLAADLNVAGIAVLGATGSVIGEATAYLVGRAGRGVVEKTSFFLWLQRQLRTPLRAFVVLFLLSAPPNPFFDVAGLAAGSLGVPFPLFAFATFCGRIVRLVILAYVGQTIFTGS